MLERNTYTFFDFSSDIGGYISINAITFAYLSKIWNFNQFDNFMVSRLFKIRKPEDEIEEDVHFFRQSVFIKKGSMPYFKDILNKFLSKCC